MILVYLLPCEVLKLTAVLPRRNIFYEVGNICLTSERWDSAIIFDMSDLWIFEPQLPSRDCAINWP